MTLRALAAATGLLVATTTAAGAGTFPRFGAPCARADYMSAGVRVPAEFCPAPGSVTPAVVVLHGCGGFSTFDHRLATELPAFGISTLDVDYFARTPPPNRKGFCRHGGDPARAFPTWVSLVNDAQPRLQTLGIRVAGLVGWSLGGDLALATAASRGGVAFAAAVAFSGGPPAAATSPATLPPSMLLFGGRTDRDLVAQTRRLRRTRPALAARLRVYVYPAGTHQWPRLQGSVGIARAAAFLRALLAPRG